MKQAVQRLQRLERMRAIARQTAAIEAAEAESKRAQLAALADRTGLLAADYARADHAFDGAALVQAARFAGSLQNLRRATSGDSARAQVIADQRMVTLAEAERRRAVIDDRLTAARAKLAAKARVPALAARKTWHET
jgi:hypothetical protein